MIIIKKKVMLTSCVFVFIICIIIGYITFCTGPVISYNASSLTDYENEYTQIAELCYKDYVQINSNKDYVVYSVLDTDSKSITCYSDKHTISLTDEEYNSAQIIQENFRLDKHNLEHIVVYDNFVSFGIANGRASFVYSVNDEKPSFVDYPNSSEKISVEKICDNWYYVCKQN